MSSKIHTDAINALVHGHHGAPYDVLGMHEINDKTLSIRVFRPKAKTVRVVNDETGERATMQQTHETGFFVAEVSKKWKDLPYYLECTFDNDKTLDIIDPYRFPPQLSEFDLYLFGTGRHLNSYDKLGAHPMIIDGVEGIHFVVWAPNAFRVSVVGDFNFWDARIHPMHRNGESGVWELFIPEAKLGQTYKYDILSTVNDYQAQKTDPYGFFAELRPNTASVIVDLETYEWGDDEWMEQRTKVDPLTQPMNAYEVHLGSWRLAEGKKWMTYRELADELVRYVKEMNYTHIELMPVMEHPFDGSWGYQVTGYFAPTSRFGTPEDFMYFVDTCHQNGIGVILDWVPAHFPKDGHALNYFDGTYLYEHADPRQGEHPDWGTLIFNYGRNEVKNFLLSNALFWLKKYHIDGLRVDAVSSMIYLDFSREEGQWVPNQYGGNENLEAIQFLKEFNTVVHEECPGAVTIAEESTAWAMVSRPVYIGGLGFTFKWNMGWMHDTLKYISEDPVHRRYHHNKLTFSMMYAFSENFVLSLSHDEVVHGKGSLMGKIAGDWWQKFATLRLLTGYQMTHPGKKLMFMGQDIAQWSEWSEARSLDWHLLDLWTHQGVNQFVKDMNALYLSEPALYEQDFVQEGFQWIEANDIEQSVFSYIRYAKDEEDFVVVVCNFTPVTRENYRIGVPQEGKYQEILNSDAEVYGGGNVGNSGSRMADNQAWHQFGYSLRLTLPPLGIVILKPES